MKGNNQIFSDNKVERIKGYKKLLKKNHDSYNPPKQIVTDIVEAMEAQGYDVSEEEVTAYLNSSYAVFERSYFKNDRR